MRVVVGRIGRPHGIKGETTVEPRTDEPELRFVPGAQLLREDGGTPLVIAAVRWANGRLLIEFEGCDTRDDAEALRGTLLEVERGEGTPEDPEEFYDTQLVGCQAVGLDGARIGEVTAVLHLPGQDVLAVLDDAGREVLVPFVAEIVPEVDAAARRIVIDPPAGLLEPE